MVFWCWVVVIRKCLFSIIVFGKEMGVDYQREMRGSSTAAVRRPKLRSRESLLPSRLYFRVLVYAYPRQDPNWAWRVQADLRLLD